MMDEKEKNTPRSQSITTSFPDPSQIRKQAEKKAKVMPVPDLDSMTHEEIQHIFHEMKVKQIEAELQNEQLRSHLEERDAQAPLLRIVTENMLDMVAMTDIEGNFLFAGKSHEILGYEPGFLIGKNVMDFVHPDDLPYVLEEFNVFVASGDIRRVEYRNRCRDGSYLWLETMGKMLKDENSNPHSIVFNSRDITDRKRVEEELYKSEAMTQALLNGIPESAFLIEPDGTIIAANTMVAQRLNCPMGELIGSNVFTLVSKRVAEFRRKFLDKVLETGKPVLFKDVRLGRDIENRINPILDQDGKVTRLAIVGIDFTERRRAEKSLRENRDLLDTTQRLAKIGGWEWDVGRQTMSWTDEAYHIHGFEPGEVAAGSPEHIHRSLACYDPDDRLVIEAAFRRCAEEGKPYDLEVPFTTVHGQRKWVKTIAQAVMEDNRIVKVIGNIMDITERKQAEDELTSSLSLLNAALDSTADGILVVNRNGIITRYNQKFAEMWRIPQKILTDGDDDAALNHILDQIVDPESFLSKVEHLYAHPEESSFDQIEFKEGTIFERYSQPQKIGSDIVGRVWSFRDITGRKRAEMERAKLQAELTQAQKLESVGRLAGGVAHDFNNKLTIINGYAEMAIDMMDPSDPLRKTIQEIYTAGNQSALIVRQLLAFARQQTISPVQLDLNLTISSMLKMLQRLIGENIDLEWHPGKKLHRVKIDPSQVDQIMANLSLNARDAISDVGKLTIETKNTIVDEDYCRSNPEAIPGRYVMLAVSDDGCGMEKKVRDQLFEPFFTTKAVGKGTGLGLPTIYGIVKQNKGFINVYSEPGEGTTFKLYFPSSEAEKSSAYTAKKSTDQMFTGTETVLLVEDEPEILHMGRGMLEKLGYNVLTAEKPDAALRLAEEYEGKIHLLITDVIMPEMNGRDLSAKLSDCSPGLKTIYISGYTGDFIAHHGVLDEGVHFIEKPFSIKDLAVKVRQAIEQE